MAIRLAKLRPIYWENTVEGHNKFWAAQIIKESKNYILVRKWGAIGTIGQKMEQSFATEWGAETALDKLIFQKENEGYKPIF